MQPSRQLPPRWTAVILTSVLATLCAVGILDAVEGGHHPGKHPRGVIRPYPTEAVAWNCGVIIVEAVILFCILRPNSFSRRSRRSVIALAVSVLLWIADFFLVSARTDLPAYCYSNHFFLTYVVLFLGILSVLTLPLSDRRNAKAPGHTDLTKP